MDSHHEESSAPYNSAASFIDFFAGFTYDHVNFIFARSSPMQDSSNSPVCTDYYKFEYYESRDSQNYINNNQLYEVDDILGSDEYRRAYEISSSAASTERTQQSQEMLNENVNTSYTECPRTHRISQDYQAIWEDYIDPDNMSYEELLELGESVGTQSRGLTQEQISLLPISKFKTCIFVRKKSQSERCVVCQMEYKRGDRIITLPCKHKYHANCATKWLSINKACPICYTEVSLQSIRFK